MAVVQTGRATVHGFAGGISFSGIGTLYSNSGEFTDEFTLRDLRDGQNDVKGHQASGRLWRAHLVFVPVAASGTNTLANAKTSLAPPGMLAVVTLSNFDYSGFNIDWNYAGGWKVGFTRDDQASYELDLVANPDEDISAIAS